MQDFQDISRLVAHLNPAQKEAVAAPPEHRLVLAGAGSGKTRVLVHRIAWLIAVENVSPLSILAVTFTNKAAHEMRGRIEQLLTVPTRSMWVGTFHGIAHRMLRLHWREAGLQQGFTILDADDQVRFVKRVIKSLDMSDEQWPAKVVTSWINSQKEEAKRPGHLDDLGDYTQRQYVRIYAAYEEACARAGLVDFAELLLRAYEITRDNESIQQHYRSRFRHLLVDEFQDTNTLQYAWLKVLAGERGVVFAVGDDDQSVYSWRGARVENMLRFEKDFPGAEIVRLEQNYRSTGNILKAANELIAKNASRLGKNLWTQDPEGEPIAMYAAFNEYDEAEFVANRMREHIDGRGRNSDIAVLYRSNAQSRVLEEILIRHRIPYRIYGGVRFFERQEIKDALAWLRLLKNRDDDVSFERAVGTPPRGVGATTLEKIREIAKASQVSFWSAAKNASNQLGRSSGKVLEFLAGVETLTKETSTMRLSDATELVIARTGLREHYRKEKGEQAESRLENLDELVSAARGFELNPGAGRSPGEEGEPEPEMDPLTAFLTHAALESGDEQAAPGEDGVQLMTLHAAKGLEFPIVFMVGVENGLFPSMRAVEEGNLEEERRLCYVGLTRAKKKLYLSYAEIRRVHGIEQIGAPSMFLREIPQECLVEVRPRAGLLRPVYGGGSRDRESSGGYGSGGGHGSRGGGYGSARSDYDGLRPVARPRPVPGGDTSTGPGGFKLGQRVQHAKFGEGTILAFDGDGDRARVEVRFGRESKWLVLSFANLRAV